ncbi:HECT-like ubiquitin-conjugating enzyme (E2)-binding domain-containing protein [Sarocladium implicatum]|nr:HECT-like ubiquitin-conjugating enzyme (E2)-binding domain-containing protein [Sarocladium implicatum]
MGISVYAELLSNLRQLSVVASLPSPSDSTTSASISEDGSSLKVQHRGESQLLLLPAAPNRSVLGVPAQASTALTWRLRLPASDGPPKRFALEDQDPPWNARDLRIGSPVKCRACGKCLVSETSILEWKDLPSDNWAEMMEFWHCHKPVDHSDKTTEANGNPTTANKGYGANNVITTQQAVGLVDVTSLVFSTADCNAIVVSD